MWTEIKSDDLKNLQVIQDILLGMHPAYSRYTPELLSKLISFRQDMRQKAHLYQDGDYEICCMMKVDTDNRMHIVTAGVRKFADMQTASDLLNKKFLFEMGDLGCKYAYGQAEKGNTPLAQDFYGRLHVIGKQSGFYDVTTTDTSVYDVVQFYKEAPDDTVVKIIPDSAQAADAAPAEEVKK